MSTENSNLREDGMMTTPVEWARKALAGYAFPDEFQANLASDTMILCFSQAQADARRATIEECAKVAETPTDERMRTHPEHIDGCCGSAIAAEIRALAKP